MTRLLDDFFAFLNSSPTPYHAAAEIGNRLSTRDFCPLREEEPWKLEAGSRYFFIRDGALCAFALPRQTPRRSIIVASHTDSPGLKVKPHPEIYGSNMTTLGVEVYGGALLFSWLARDLGIAGRVIVAGNRGETAEHLVLLDDVPLFIPPLAIHLDRQVNEKGLIINKQEHLRPLLGLGHRTLEELLHRHLSFEKLLSFDLQLVPLEKARFIGNGEEMISSWRLDNLAGVHACATALTLASPSDEILQMAIFYDHEEIGSRSTGGADSALLPDLLQRIGHGLGLKEDDFYQIKARSLCLSVDMAHAFHPNYPTELDPQHQPLLGGGVVLKYNADQKYATDASSAAPVIQGCSKLGLPLQTFVSRSDKVCGSTVGPFIAKATGIQTVDIGSPQLAMHAARELMASSDHLAMCHLLTHLLQGNHS